MGVLQTYAIGFGVPSAQDIFGLNDDANVVIGEGVIEFNSSSDGDGPEKNRVTSYSEILTEDNQDSETEGIVTGMTRLSFIALKAFENAETVLGTAEINFIEIGKEVLSDSILCGSEVSPTLSILYVEESYNIAGVTIVSAKEDFISPSHSIVVQGETNILDRDLYSAVDGGLCYGQASLYPFEKDVATPAEYRVRTIDGLIANESEIVGRIALDTADQYYGLTSTENPFPPPLTAHPEYGQSGDGVAIGTGVIKYNRDNIAIAVGNGAVSSEESVGYLESQYAIEVDNVLTGDFGATQVVGTSKISSEELFPTKYDFIASPVSPETGDTSYEFVIQYPTTTTATLPPVAEDFTVTGTAGWTVFSVSGSGYGPYLITVSGAADSGTVGLYAFVEPFSNDGTGVVVGNADIRDLSQVTILNKPAQAYEVVITGAVGDGTQIVYEAINDLVAGEDVVISRNRPSDPADWWCLGASVINSSTGTTFTVLSASTGSYSSSPENDGYAIVTSSADRYGVDGPQRYPSVDDYSIDINSDVFVKNINFKYNISALESYTYQAALTAFSGGESFVTGDLVGDPFVLVGDAIVDVIPLVEGGVINYRGSVSNQYGLPSLNNNFDDCFYLEDEGSFRLWNGSSWIPAGGVSGTLTVFLAGLTSGYGGQGSPAGIYGTGVYT